LDVQAYLEWAEGKHNEPYKDTKGLLTVGIGHLLERRYTDAEVDQMFRDDLYAVLERCEALPYWNELNDARQAVIISLIFNVGYNGFLGFQKFRAALSRGDYASAADELVDSKRSREDIGKARSDAEHQMMRTGEWPEIGG